MAKGRYINTHFWDDNWIIDLDPIEKLLFLYLLTNPCTDISGVYEISLRRMAFDTGIDKDMVIKILERFEKANKIVYQDGWVIVLNWQKNQSMNPSVKAGVARSVENYPQWVKDKITQHLGQAGYRLGTGSPQDALLNLTLPNLTLPNGEAPKKKVDSPLQTSGSQEINIWLDATAPLVGAASRETMNNPRKWRDAVEKAVREQHDITDWLSAVNIELNRTRTTPHFFSPENVLKVLQSKRAKQPTGGFLH